MCPRSRRFVIEGVRSSTRSTPCRWVALARDPRPPVPSLVQRARPRARGSRISPRRRQLVNAGNFLSAPQREQRKGAASARRGQRQLSLPLKRNFTDSGSGLSSGTHCFAAWAVWDSGSPLLGCSVGKPRRPVLAESGHHRISASAMSGLAAPRAQCVKADGDHCSRPIAAGRETTANT